MKISSIFKFGILSFLSLSSIVGCTDKEESSKGIELTTDNIDSYLELSVSTYGKTIGTGSYYTHVESAIDVTPASENYIYNDVILTIKVYGTVKLIRSGGTKAYNQSLICSLNKGGKGKNTTSDAISSLVDASLPYAEKVTGSFYEVTTVSGTVELVR